MEDSSSDALPELRYEIKGPITQKQLHYFGVSYK